MFNCVLVWLILTGCPLGPLSPCGPGSPIPPLKPLFPGGPPWPRRPGSPWTDKRMVKHFVSLTQYCFLCLISFRQILHFSIPLVQCCPVLLEVPDRLLCREDQLCQEDQHLHRPRALPGYTVEMRITFYSQKQTNKIVLMAEVYLCPLSHRHAFTAIFSRDSIHPRHAFLSLSAHHTSGTK